MHGIINVIPPMPEEIPVFGAIVEGGSDEYGQLQVAASSGTNSDGFGIVMHGTDDGGWRDSSGFEEEKLNAVWTHTQGGGQWKLSLAGSNLNQETAGFIVGQDAYRDPAIARSNPDPDAYRNATEPASSPRSTAGPRVMRRAFTCAARAWISSSISCWASRSRTTARTAAASCLSATRALAGGEIIAGIDAEFAQSSLLQYQNGPTTDGSPAANAIRPAGKHYDYDVDSEVVAGYADWRRPLASRWTLEAGLRLEYAHYDYDNRMIDGNTDEDGVPCPGGCLYSRPADRSDDFTNLAPRLGLVFSIADSTTAYVSLARGFRAPEATELYRLQRQQTVADLDSETADSAEAWAALAGNARLARPRAVYMDKDGVILRDSAGFNVTGGKTRHEGLEYEGDIAIADDWSLSAAGTIARHEYRFTAAVEQGEQITSGNDMDTAPRNIHSLRLHHDAAWLDAELEWLWIGDYWANAANTARYGGHDLGNLRLSVEPAGTGRSAVRITNLLDAAYADRADFAFGDYRYFPGRGRAYFVELGWRKD